MFVFNNDINLPPYHHGIRLQDYHYRITCILMFVFENDIKPATMPPLYKTATLSICIFLKKYLKTATMPPLYVNITLSSYFYMYL